MHVQSDDGLLLIGSGSSSGNQFGAINCGAEAPQQEYDFFFGWSLHALVKRKNLTALLSFVVDFALFLSLFVCIHTVQQVWT